jgi:23S rRNA (cytosine1962-C5)-methyltransferase
MPTVVLEPGRDVSLRRRHPWLLSGAIARVDGGQPAPGAYVAVHSAAGEPLGYGHYEPGSQLRVRLVAFGREPVEEAALGLRLAAAVARRASDPLLTGTDALRLVNAEGDGLPGLVVDRYADLLVVRPSTSGMIRCVPALAPALRAATGARAALLRPDAVSLRRSGVEVAETTLWGAAPEAPIAVDERGRAFRVDVRAGQKTGFYLDQRDARDLVATLAAGRRVLDAFAYTGGFAVAALQGGAERVTLLESSRSALALAREHVAFAAARAELALCDAFERLHGGAGDFDLVVLDPPPLARRKADVPRASRAHKDLLLHAFRGAAPGGLVLAFACSYHVGPELFQKIAFGAALDAGREVAVLCELGAPSDHPVSLYHPEGRYLTGLLLRVDA